MKRFKNILYVLGSDITQEEMIAKKVRHLALLNNAKVSIIRSVEESFTELFGKTLSPRLAKLSAIGQNLITEELEHFANDSQWDDITTSHQVLRGRDFIKIIQHVIANGHDLVVKGANPINGTDQLAMRLFRKCPCPVWIIQSSAPQDFKGILAALDISNQQEENILLNKKIVELTQSLAEIEQGEAHFLYSWCLDFEDILRSPRFDISREEIHAEKKEMEQIGRQAVMDVFKSAGVAPPASHIHIVEGELSEVITKTLMDYSVDTLVMGTVARSGVPGLLIGNTAEKVLTKVTCTVLAVKPDGFTTPIKL